MTNISAVFGVIAPTRIHTVGSTFACGEVGRDFAAMPQNSRRQPAARKTAFWRACFSIPSPAFPFFAKMTKKSGFQAFGW
jgi:hypothetical protein